MIENRVIVACVPPVLVELLWDKIEPHVQRVIEVAGDELHMPTFKKRLLLGETLVLSVSQGQEMLAAITLDVREFDTGLRALYIPIVGGEKMESWMDRVIEVAIAIAKDHNCTELRGLAARKGWLKKLAPLGWQEVQTVVSLQIEA